MNKDILQGKWHEIKGAVRAKWGKLTDDDCAIIQGNNEELFGLLQKRYGMGREEAEKEIKQMITH